MRLTDAKNAVHYHDLNASLYSVLLNTPQAPVFDFFETWKAGKGDAQAEFRASVARGNDVFLNRQF